jgi:acetyl esterase/lipase
VFSVERLDPDLRVPFLALPATDPDDDLATARRAHAAEVGAAVAAAEPCPRAAISDRHIPGPLGNDTLRVRVYRPVQDSASVARALLWMHGGGFTRGSPETDEVFCRRVCVEADCTVVSVDYRLAPEDPFPAAIEDCYAALVWIAGGFAGPYTDVARIALGGASAGGGLAAGLALLARDRGGPDACFQFLKYPCLDDRLETASSREITDLRLWNRQRLVRAWRDYLGPDRHQVSAYAAPGRAEDFSRLPAAYIYAAEVDPLRDEDVDYARRLLEAGVSVELHLVRGTFHGSDGVAPEAPVSRRNLDEFTAVIRRAVHPPGEGSS